MIESTNTIITISSMIIAILAVIIGPWLSARAQRKAMLGQMRQQWINDLRKLIAKLLSESDFLCVLKSDNRQLENDGVPIVRSMTLIEDQISLMLNHNEPDHCALMVAMHTLAIAALKGDGKKCEKLNSEVMEQSVNILKTEWEVVKKR